MKSGKGFSIVVTIHHNIMRLEKNNNNKSSKELLHIVESNSRFLRPKCFLIIQK